MITQRIIFIQCLEVCGVFISVFILNLRILLFITLLIHTTHLKAMLCAGPRFKNSP